MDTFVTPLCCKVFCSFYVWEIFFFQNTLLLDFVARISIIKTVQIIMVLHVCILLGFNKTHQNRIFFFKEEKEGRGRKTLFVWNTKRGFERREEERLPKDSN
mgnify:CR=1 FL=1